ncbi:MAG: enoyl-CoA hydratase/isomerase family protein [Bdellovibrionales bacterium]|nr:enoyl-CoA hydratase/isomerase family protein [Bdellovibrionales bacterium]
MFVKTDLKNEIFKITLNRPEVRNAFHPQMIDELTKAFQDADASPARMVFLSGEGKSFCAGADLDWMKSMKNYSLEENKKDSEKLFSMFEAAKDCTLPILGEVQGHVMGGALGLVAICDFVVAESETKFCFSEVKLGLVPAVISPFVLRKMNASFARQAMLTGQVFASKQALQHGLIQFSGSLDECKNILSKVAQDFFNAAPQAVRETKALINKVHQPFFNGLKEETARVIAERRVSDEGQAGLSAFFSKQDVPWKKDFNGSF